MNKYGFKYFIKEQLSMANPRGLSFFSRREASEKIGTDSRPQNKDQSLIGLTFRNA